MEAAGYFEMLLNLYQTTRHHNHKSSKFKVSQGTHSLTVVACLNLLKSVRVGKTRVGYVGVECVFRPLVLVRALFAFR